MKTVIEMAREAGFETKRGWGLRDSAPEDIFAAAVNITREIEAFTALVRADALAAQPAQRTWVGLTVAEMEELTLLVGRMDYTRMLQLAEAKLKEKNT